MLDAVKWLERIIDELSHKRRKELYQEWLRDWTMSGVITYEIDFSQVAQLYKDEATQKQHLANEEYKVALQLAGQMVDPAVMEARMVPSKLPIMKRELLVVCLRTRAASAEATKDNLIVLPVPLRGVKDLDNVSNKTQVVDELEYLDKSKVEFAGKSAEVPATTEEPTDNPLDKSEAMRKRDEEALNDMLNDMHSDSEPPPKSAT